MSKQIEFNIKLTPSEVGIIMALVDLKYYELKEINYPNIKHYKNLYKKINKQYKNQAKEEFKE